MCPSSFITKLLKHTSYATSSTNAGIIVGWNQFIDLRLHMSCICFKFRVNIVNMTCFFATRAICNIVALVFSKKEYFVELFGFSSCIDSYNIAQAQMSF